MNPMNDYYFIVKYYSNKKPQGRRINNNDLEEVKKIAREEILQDKKATGFKIMFQGLAGKHERYSEIKEETK